MANIFVLLPALMLCYMCYRRCLYLKLRNGLDKPTEETMKVIFFLLEITLSPTELKTYSLYLWQASIRWRQALFRSIFLQVRNASCKTASGLTAVAGVYLMCSVESEVLVSLTQWLYYSLIAYSEIGERVQLISRERSTPLLSWNKWGKNNNNCQ